MAGEAVLCGDKTYEEYKTIFEQLPERQLEWLRGKCRWEHMTPWATMQEFGVPSHDELKESEK